MDDGVARDEIERLEARIDALTDKIENCRKFILASRVLVGGGGLVFAAIVFGVMRFDPAVMALAIAAMLGGVAVWGSNGSTTKQAAAELKAVEAKRATLIGMMELRVIAGSDTLH